MKKSSFVAMIMGTVSGIFFAFGMCTVLLPEWDAFEQGIGLGCIGMVLGGITAIVWRRMEHKAPIRISMEFLLKMAVILVGMIFLGIGMSLVMVWHIMALGIGFGMVGIVLLLLLIPLMKGIQE